MRLVRPITLLVSLVLLAGVLAWLGHAPNSPAISHAGDLVEAGTALRIGIIPERDIYQQRQRYRLLADYLQERLGRRVELVTNSSYEGVLDDFAAHRIDGAFLGSLVAVLATDRFGVEGIAKPETVDGVSTYAGVVFVKADSPVQTFKQLRGHTLGAVRTTTAGALFALELMAKDGLTAGVDGPSMVWSGTHDDVIREVVAGRIDAGAVKDLRLDAYEAAHPQTKLRRIATSGRVPENGLLMRHDLPAPLVAKLRDVLLRMHDDAAGRKVLSAMGLRRFVPCSAAEYHGVFEMLDAVGPRWPELEISGRVPRPPAKDTLKQAALQVTGKSPSSAPATAPGE